MTEPLNARRSNTDRQLDAVPRPKNAHKETMIGEREHIVEILAAYPLWQLGARMSDSDESIWRLLADKLGLSVEQIAAASSEQPQNPGYGVLVVWSRQKNSKIGVLRRTLEEELKRADLVEMLDKARQSKLASSSSSSSSSVYFGNTEQDSQRIQKNSMNNK